MQVNIGKEVAALQRMTLRELQAKYAETFGEATKVGNKAWLSRFAKVFGKIALRC